MGLIEDGASDEQLKAEEQRLLAQSQEMTERGLLMLKEAMHHASDGTEPDQERYMKLHADYMLAHEQHMQVHADFMQIHEELQRRGR